MLNAQRYSLMQNVLFIKLVADYLGDKMPLRTLCETSGFTRLRALYPWSYLNYVP